MTSFSSANGIRIRQRQHAALLGIRQAFSQRRLLDAATPFGRLTRRARRIGERLKRDARCPSARSTPAPGVSCQRAAIAAFRAKSRGLDPLRLVSMSRDQLPRVHREREEAHRAPYSSRDIKDHVRDGFPQNYEHRTAHGSSSVAVPVLDCHRAPDGFSLRPSACGKRTTPRRANVATSRSRGQDASSWAGALESWRERACTDFHFQLWRDGRAGATILWRGSRTARLDAGPSALLGHPFTTTACSKGALADHDVVARAQRVYAGFWRDSRSTERGRPAIALLRQPCAS